MLLQLVYRTLHRSIICDTFADCLVLIQEALLSEQSLPDAAF